MIHFVRSGGVIPAAHLDYLIARFVREGIPHRVDNEAMCPDRVEEGDAYVACDLGMDLALRPVADKVFQVQMQHNLTGLKGSFFGDSHANLSILAGEQVMRTCGISANDPRFAILGYAKWDAIHAERFRQDERRSTLAAAHGLDTDALWALFYPTGPHTRYSANHERAWDILRRLEDEVPAFEFIFCNHEGNVSRPDVEEVVSRLRRRAVDHQRLHIVDGADTLPVIAACDLFITDIASTLLTAVSMCKPVLFLPVHHTMRSDTHVKLFQADRFFDEVDDLLAFVSGYTLSEEMSAMFRRCVAFDDDQNCARIAAAILDEYARWGGQP